MPGRARRLGLVLACALGLALAAAPAAGARVYWTNENTDSIGRANLDGTGANQSFITGAIAPVGVAVDPAAVYWTNLVTVEEGGGGGLAVGTIGRANLDGTGANQSFITGASSPFGVAVDGAHVYWTNQRFGSNSIGRANLDGTGANQSYTLTEPATVRFGILRRNAGRKANSKCAKPTRKTKAGKKCDLPLTGSFTHQGTRGKNSLPFRGRLGTRKLEPGPYQLTATATDKAGNASKPTKATFKINKR